MDLVVLTKVALPPHETEATGTAHRETVGPDQIGLMRVILKHAKACRLQAFQPAVLCGRMQLQQSQAMTRRRGAVGLQRSARCLGDRVKVETADLDATRVDDALTAGAGRQLGLAVGLKPDRVAIHVTARGLRLQRCALILGDIFNAPNICKQHRAGGHEGQTDRCAERLFAHCFRHG
ncbi:MAG: hypothetical protein BWZ07_01366 [Alphaproteobacteria bacterium ADurb.BinA280]|nr:MAG: hypothetical protein BWZ07_01366 [Alphaproteobacteria bacterium ADurb.BinA280]